MARHRCNASAGRCRFDNGAEKPVRARGRRLSRVALLAGVCFALLLEPAASTSSDAGATATGLFGSREFHSTNLTKFPKWRGALERFEEELASCAAHACSLQEWRSLLSPLDGVDAKTQLRLVNRAINKFRYVEDYANWQRADYWATPLQFLDRSGDCEDFAIAKYMALRELGIPSGDMRIVILRDHARHAMHAVLAVYVDGRPYILDNLRDGVVAADNIRTYEPIYSINEQGWWLHRI